MSHDLREVRRVLALALRSPLCAGRSLLPLAGNCAMSAARMVATEPAELIEPFGVRTVEDLGGLDSGQAEPTLVEHCLSCPVELGQLANERHLPKLGPVPAMDTWLVP